jgi:DNA-binding transcriptional LysR family regulator
VAIDVAIGNSADVLAWLKADRVQFGLVEAPLQDREIDIEAVGQDELLLVAARTYRVTRHGALTPASLAHYPLLRREVTSGTQQLIDTELTRHGANSPTLMILGSTEALKQAVLAGIGMAWLPRLAVMHELSSGKLTRVQVEGLRICRTLSLIRPKESAPSAAADALLGEVRRALTAFEP